MRQAALAVAVLAGCIAVSVAGAASPPQAVTSPGPVTAIGLDVPNVAFASGPAARSCRVAIWNRSTGKVVRLGRVGCDETSTGSAIATVAVAKTRALWLHYTGGNIREWRLFTATTTRPQPRELAFMPVDVDDPSPIVVGEADGSRYGDYLPYAVGSTVVVLAANGRRVHTYRASARVTALSAFGGGIAIALADGRVVVLDSVDNWRVERESSGSPAATGVFVTGNGVAAQRGRVVELRKGDETTNRVTIPADGVLRDATGSGAVYTTRGRVKLVDVESGRTRDLGAGTSARMEALTVAIASGRTVRLVRLTN